MKDNLSNELNSNDPVVSEEAIKKSIRIIEDQKLRASLRQKIPFDRPTSHTNSKRNYSVVLFGLLAILILSVLIYVINKQTNDLTPQQYAMEIYQHPGLSKSANNADYVEATQAYRNENWSKAATAFESMEKQTNETKFFAGLSYLYQNEINKSIPYFQTLASSDSNYSIESKWYLALCFLMNNDEEKALPLLNEIKNGDWKAKEAKRLLELYKK